MKKAVSVVVLYTLAMAVGLYYVKSSKNVAYSDPTFIEHFFWILVGLATATVLYCLIFRRDASLPLRGERRWLMYLIVMVPIVVGVVVGVTTQFKPTWAFFAPLLGTLLVGVGEEIAFRRVFFGALLKKSAREGKTVAGPILISSLAFSLLHAVNVLGGQSVGQVGIQLVLTFLSGILFACLYLQTKSLVALIIFHWLWDALTFMGLEKSIKAMLVIMPLLLVVQIVIGLMMFWQYRNKKASEFVDVAEDSGIEPARAHA